MAKYLKLEGAYAKDDGRVEVEFWLSDSETYGSFNVSAENVFTPEEVAENEGVTEEAAHTCESLQKVISDLNKELSDMKSELEKVKAEKEKLESDYDRVISTKDVRIEELKERICIMSGEKETYKECLEVIVDKICEHMG